MTKSLLAAQRLANLLDLPADGLTGAPQITMNGGCRVTVEGHRGLLEYAEDRIAAAGAGCRIIIKGSRLALAAMDKTRLVVTGQIWAVELE